MGRPIGFKFLLGLAGVWFLFKVLTVGALFSTASIFSSPLLWVVIGVFFLIWLKR